MDPDIYSDSSGDSSPRTPIFPLPDGPPSTRRDAEISRRRRRTLHFLNESRLLREQLIAYHSVADTVSLPSAAFASDYELNVTSTETYYDYGEPTTNSGSEKIDSYWITAFGYPADALNVVLFHLSNCGDIVDQQNSQGNWVHIKFNHFDAVANALSLNGKELLNDVMIGVQLYYPRENENINFETFPIERRCSSQSILIFGQKVQIYPIYKYYYIAKAALGRLVSILSGFYKFLFEFVLE